MLRRLQKLIVILACSALAGPVPAQVARMTADEFRARFNAASSWGGLGLRLEPWKQGLLGATLSTAVVTRNIAVIAEVDSEHRLSSVLLVMRTTGTLKSVMEMVATLAATTYAANPELSDEGREDLFEELGLYEEDWGRRGLDGIAVRNGLTYRVIHPGGDPLILLLVSWPVSSEPASPTFPRGPFANADLEVQAPAPRDKEG